MDNSHYCLLCKKLLQRELTWRHIFSFKQILFEAICAECNSKFKEHHFHENNCEGCGRQLEKNSHDAYQKIYEIQSKKYCHDCYLWLETYPDYYLHHRFIFTYNLFFKEWLYQYKYQGDARLAKVMRHPLRHTYQELKNYTWIYLPSSEQNKVMRGFHATGYLLKEAGIPCFCPFNYTGDGVRQASKGRQDRLQLMKCFEPCYAYTKYFQTIKKWLLFDDLYTTGATIMRAKEVLYDVTREHGNASIQVMSLSLARDNLLIDEM
ncbi:ComF family protein [Facklamia sp. DSM 111018]|uniref:ComF family protein n=1 Tax=Facklamia lactis TaxID=2749967 RepID=A0ABS0LSE2_9LACT|nr:ComF family protein [Facklamia lactis]MBG9981443.1 ComF family protein [Facklamia lactis]MBG9987081.1 ComF family protein [Facklamia lactis]